VAQAGIFRAFAVVTKLLSLRWSNFRLSLVLDPPPIVTIGPMLESHLASSPKLFFYKFLIAHGRLAWKPLFI